MTISEKVAYIQGLFDGLKLDTEKSGEARILSEVLDVLREVGQQLDGMDAAMDQFDQELDILEDTETLAAGVVDCPVCGGKFALSFEDEDDGSEED